MEKEKVLVPTWALKMITIEGYLERFFYHLRLPNITYKKAYELTEQEFQQFFPIKKYKSFQSFRQMTYYHRKKKIKGRLGRPKPFKKGSLVVQKRKSVT